MKLRNILITAAAVGMMFASSSRTDVVGYTAGDYSDMNTFAHKVAGQNVAYTAGNDFTAVWTDGGTTWGFSGGDATQLVDMMWSNGTYGLSVGLDMPAGGDTTFDLGFGMNLMGWDVGFGMNTVENGPMSLNARGGCGFWAFDTMTVGYHAATTAGGTDYTVLDLGMYGVHNWGAATGMFGMGVTSTDEPGQGWVDPATLVNTSFSVESTLTDWCDLRIGYNKSFNMSAADGESVSTDSYHAGLGFNYGSVALDMIITDATLDAMVSNPLQYVNGRNASPLAASWTLSYTW
jgi:hypothetical protein